MKCYFALFCCVSVFLALWSGVEGGEKKEVTIKGNITCAKCELKKETKCMTVIVEKKDGKDIIYYFVKASDDKFHEDICSGGMKGSVTGIVTEKDKKKYVEVKELKYDKK
jgi:magnesium-transporting ATPase (P-type)